MWQVRLPSDRSVRRGQQDTVPGRPEQDRRGRPDALSEQSLVRSKQLLNLVPEKPEIF